MLFRVKTTLVFHVHTFTEKNNVLCKKVETFSKIARLDIWDLGEIARKNTEISNVSFFQNIENFQYTTSLLVPKNEAIRSII